MLKYFAKKVGGVITDKDAKIIGGFLDKHFPDGKGIHPKQLVELARPGSSPIHKYFEWNDKKAAEDHRLQQARQILTSIVVHVDDKDVRAFHNIKIEKTEFDSSSREYWRIDTAKRTPSIWDQVVKNALKEIYQWRERYEAYAKLSPIIRAIDKFKEKEESNEKSKTSNRGSVRG